MKTGKNITNNISERGCQQVMHSHTFSILEVHRFRSVLQWRLNHTVTSCNVTDTKNRQHQNHFLPAEKTNKLFLPSSEKVYRSNEYNVWRHINIEEKNYNEND